MKESLKTLNLPENAAREEIDRAYHALMERYDAAKYFGSPLSDMAAEKRRRIRAAYEALTSDRPEPAPEPAATEWAGTGDSPPLQSVSVRVRSLLNDNDLEGAEALLKAQPDLETDPELIYLRGMVCWKRGWLDEAARAVKRASRLEPQNAEYRAAQDKILLPPPSLSSPGKSWKTRGKWLWGACGACGAECACEAVFEVLCDSLCGGC